MISKDDNDKLMTKAFIPKPLHKNDQANLYKVLVNLVYLRMLGSQLNEKLECLEHLQHVGYLTNIGLLPAYFGIPETEDDGEDSLECKHFHRTV
ncbi:hypothetical protein SFRURICE_012286 [Spodoptera frugiperda]|nr:hypothetical protein SFRURICE_012286 [Spodoptera frugiperda]